MPWLFLNHTLFKIEDKRSTIPYCSWYINYCICSIDKQCLNTVCIENIWQLLWVLYFIQTIQQFTVCSDFLKQLYTVFRHRLVLSAPECVHFLCVLFFFSCLLKKLQHKCNKIKVILEKINFTSLPVLPGSEGNLHCGNIDDKTILTKDLTLPHYIQN